MFLVYFLLSKKSYAPYQFYLKEDVKNLRKMEEEKLKFETKNGSF